MLALPLMLAAALTPQAHLHITPTGPLEVFFLRTEMLSSGSALYGGYQSHVGRFRWSAEAGLMPWPGLPEPGTEKFYPSASESFGATSWFDPALQRPVPARWSAATGLEVLGRLSSLSTLESVYGISADGGTVFGHFSDPVSFQNYMANPQHAFAWTAATGYVDIGDLPGGDSFSRPTAASADGSVIVGVSATGFTQCCGGVDLIVTTPFRWTAASGIEPLEPAFADSEPVAVSADGSLVLASVPTLDINDEWISLAMIFGPGGTYQGLPNARSAVAADMSDDAAVVVGHAFDLEHPNHPTGSGPFVWIPGQDAILLTDLLAEEGAGVPAGWGEFRVISISSDGRAIFGSTRTATKRGLFVATLDLPGGSLDWPLGSDVCGPAAWNSTGAGATLALNGFGFASTIPGQDPAPLQAHANGLPTGSLTMLIVSREAGFAAQPGGSQGNLCLGGTIGRYALPSQLRTADAGGAASWNLDVSAIPNSTGTGPVAAGESLYFQAWFRDANPLPTSNFTTAVVETFE